MDRYRRSSRQVPARVLEPAERRPQREVEHRRAAAGRWPRPSRLDCCTSRIEAERDRRRGQVADRQPRKCSLPDLERRLPRFEADRDRRQTGIQTRNRWPRGQQRQQPAAPSALWPRRAAATPASAKNACAPAQIDSAGAAALKAMPPPWCRRRATARHELSTAMATRRRRRPEEQRRRDEERVGDRDAWPTTDATLSVKEPVTMASAGEDAATPSGCGVARQPRRARCADDAARRRAYDNARRRSTARLAGGSTTARSGSSAVRIVALPQMIWSSVTVYEVPQMICLAAAGRRSSCPR